jgi:preprotein translocase subunit SecF
MRGIKFIPDDSRINFVGIRYVTFLISALMILASIGITATRGLNFGIDFTGGTSIEIKTPVEADVSAMRSGLNGLGLGAISIQEFGSLDDFLIRLPEQRDGGDKEAVEKVRSYLDSQFETVDYRRTEFVGPQVGKELQFQGLQAVILSLLGIMGYIWFRFEWQFGVSAVLALTHDIIAIIGFFALTQMEFNLSTVAAVLMVAGYSINDTVVVFDRIREDLRRYKKKPLPELFNISINQTLSRTLMTSLTTLLALVALYLFGGEVIRGFVDALIVGIVVGTYSSIFIATPMLLFMDVRKGRVGRDGPQPAEQATGENGA